MRIFKFLILIILSFCFFTSCFEPPENEVIDITDEAEEFYLEGINFYSESEYEKAIEFFDKALETNDEYKEALTMKAIILQEEDRLEEAGELYDRALEIDPEYIPAVNGRESLLFAQEKFKTDSEFLHPEVKNFLTEETDFILTAPEANTDGTLVRYYGTDSESFNPLNVNAAAVTNFIKNYCEDSFAERHWNNPDLWREQLAERIEITDDYKEYTIYLKKGIKWHKPLLDWSDPKNDWLKGVHYFTARDVKFTIDLILNPQVECAHISNYYKELDYCKVIDDFTIVFKWKKKVYNSLEFTVGFTPIPEFIYAFDKNGRRFSVENIAEEFNNHWYNDRFIGNGAYEFIFYEPGDKIKLKRNEFYYGDKPAIKNIEYLIYADPLQTVLKMKKRELDFTELSPSQYKEEVLEGDPYSLFNSGQIHTEKYLDLAYFYIGWNCDHPIFSDKNVRQAMSHAFNGEKILKDAFLDLGKLISGPFFIESPAYDKSLKPYEFNLDKSKKLLSEAGWKDLDNDGILEKEIDGEKKKFEFILLIYSMKPEWKTAANIYQKDLEKIGVKMIIQSLDFSILLKRTEERDFDAYTGGWALGWDDDPYQLWHSSQADAPKSSNKVSFRNKEADKIIEELRVTFDLKKRTELFHKFHRILYEEQPYTFFRVSMTVYAWQDEVKRVIFKKDRPHADSMPWYVDRGEE